MTLYDRIELCDFIWSLRIDNGDSVHHIVSEKNFLVNDVININTQGPKPEVIEVFPADPMRDS